MVRLWDVRSRRQIGKLLTGHTGGVYSVAYSPDGRTLATADDETVRLWDVVMPADLIGSVRPVPGTPSANLTTSPPRSSWNSSPS
jgi:WD40 repeat protein